MPSDGDHVVETDAVGQDCYSWTRANVVCFSQRAHRRTVYWVDSIGISASRARSTPPATGPWTLPASRRETRTARALTTFVALRNREFRLLWTGQLFSNTGLWMQSFGLGWLVVQLAVANGTPERAPLYIGFVGLSRAIPPLALSLVAGAIADRSDRRRLMLVTQSALAGVAAVLAMLTAFGAIGIVTVVVLSFLTTAFQSFDAPARQSMLPRVVPPDQIMSAIGVQSLAVNGTAVLGPALGGLLIGPVGVAGIFVANACGYLVVVACLALMRPLPVARQTIETSLFGQVGEGLGYIAHDPLLRWVFGIAITTAVFARPYVNLLPAFVANVLGLGAPELSLVLSATGGGAAAAALTVASAGRVRRRGLVYLSTVLCLGIFLVALAVQTQFWSTVALAFALGFVAMGFMALSNTIIQTTVPPRLLGRVMSVHVMMFMGVMSLGQMLLGGLGTAFGLQSVLAAGGIVVTLIAMYAIVRSTSLRNLTATAAAPMIAATTAAE